MPHLDDLRMRRDRAKEVKEPSVPCGVFDTFVAGDKSIPAERRSPFPASAKEKVDRVSSVHLHIPLCFVLVLAEVL